MKTKPRTIFTNEQIEFTKNNLIAGKTYYEIAEALKVDISVLSYNCELFDLKKYKVWKSSVNRDKKYIIITDEVRQNIINLYKNYGSIKKVADDLECAKSTIRKVAKDEGLIDGTPKKQNYNICPITGLKSFRGYW